MKNKAFWGQLAVLLASVALLCVYVIWSTANADHTPPQIEIDSAELVLSVNASKAELLQGVTAYDDVDGDVTELLVVESVYGVTEDNQITVTYAAFDRSGNVAKKTRAVRYTDYRNPRFTLCESLTYPFGKSFDVMSAVGAEDVFDGDIQHLVKATMLTSGTSVTEEGDHEVQFRVTNSVGDTVQIVLPVEVYPAGSYNAELKLTDYLIYLNQDAFFDANSFLSEFRFSNETVDLQRSIPESMDIQINGTVYTGTPGVYPVSYLASYILGGRTFTGYAKLFVVVEG